MNELPISMEKFTANFTAIPAGCLLASTLQHTGPLVTVTHTSTQHWQNMSAWVRGSTTTTTNNNN
jgi:hypothetical protein